MNEGFNEGFSGRKLNSIQRELATMRQDLKNMNKKIVLLQSKMDRIEISEQDKDIYEVEEKYFHQKE